MQQYHYQWKVIVPKMGIQKSHISGWGNEPHTASNTPDAYRVETEPHHHHHVPGDRKKRKAVRSLEQAFEFVSKYIETKTEYRVLEEIIQ